VTEPECSLPEAALPPEETATLETMTDALKPGAGKAPARRSAVA
jgi:hypothetical protein